MKELRLNMNIQIQFLIISKYLKKQKRTYQNKTIKYFMKILNVKIYLNSLLLKFFNKNKKDV